MAAKTTTLCRRLSLRPELKDPWEPVPCPCQAFESFLSHAGIGIKPRGLVVADGIQHARKKALFISRFIVKLFIDISNDAVGILEHFVTAHNDVVPRIESLSINILNNGIRHHDQLRVRQTFLISKTLFNLIENGLRLRNSVIFAFSHLEVAYVASIYPPLKFVYPANLRENVLFPEHAIASEGLYEGDAHRCDERLQWTTEMRQKAGFRPSTFVSPASQRYLPEPYDALGVEGAVTNGGRLPPWIMNGGTGTP